MLVGIRECDGTPVERDMAGADEEEVRAAAMLDGIDVLRVDRLASGPFRQQIRQGSEPNNSLKQTGPA